MLEEKYMKHIIYNNLIAITITFMSFTLIGVLHKNSNSYSNKQTTLPQEQFSENDSTENNPTPFPLNTQIPASIQKKLNIAKGGIMLAGGAYVANELNAIQGIKKTFNSITNNNDQKLSLNNDTLPNTEDEKYQQLTNDNNKLNQTTKDLNAQSLSQNIEQDVINDSLIQSDLNKQQEKINQKIKKKKIKEQNKKIILKNAQDIPQEFKNETIKNILAQTTHTDNDLQTLKQETDIAFNKIKEKHNTSVQNLKTEITTTYQTKIKDKLDSYNNNKTNITEKINQKLQEIKEKMKNNDIMYGETSNGKIIADIYNNLRDIYNQKDLNNNSLFEYSKNITNKIQNLTQDNFESISNDYIKEKFKNISTSLKNLKLPTVNQKINEKEFNNLAKDIRNKTTDVYNNINILLQDTNTDISNNDFRLKETDIRDILERNATKIELKKDQTFMKEYKQLKDNQEQIEKTKQTIIDDVLKKHTDQINDLAQKKNLTFEDATQPIKNNLLNHSFFRTNIMSHLMMQ
jgi:hypothetical protein